jgi:hypothetical protein
VFVLHMTHASWLLLAPQAGHLQFPIDAFGRRHAARAGARLTNGLLNRGTVLPTMEIPPGPLQCEAYDDGAIIISSGEPG